MKHKISNIGMGIGGIITLCSIIRWFFMFYDPSQMILGIGAGITVCGFSYVYDWMKETDEKTQKINKRLDAFTEWWAKKEIE
jgi:hypothetical protein